jgi:hypothetical protein
MTSFAPAGETDTFTLTLATLAKPFPWGPLAAAMYANSFRISTPVAIKTQQVAVIDDRAGAKLDRKPKYFNLRHSNHRGRSYSGDPLICFTLAKEYMCPNLGSKRIESSYLEEYIEYILSTDRKLVKEGLEHFNERMTFNMHSAAIELTIADFALWGAIRGNPQIVTEVLSGTYPQIEKWYVEIMGKQPLVHQITQYVQEVTVVCPRRCN